MTTSQDHERPFSDPVPIPERPDRTNPEHVVYEFFHPFVHVEGRYEWCRIVSPTHGAFNVFIALGRSTSVPATVYVDGEDGERFMRDRYPTSQVVRVQPGRLVIDAVENGYDVTGSLLADEGPIRRASMRFIADPTERPRQVPYGGTGEPIWGEATRTCWGVDLVHEARVEGAVTDHEGNETAVTGEKAVLTMGSFGRIGPR